MFTSTRKMRIEWGDCDPAGIIFFARYFEFFDVSTTMLIERALGMKKIEYLRAYNFAGHPLVETRARFLLPTRFGDEVTIDSAVVDCGRSSFKIEHRLMHDGALAVEGFETRVWVTRAAGDPKRTKTQARKAQVKKAQALKAQAMPAAVVARLTHASLVTSR
jgi:4-hydroxybenzoyl-CoA thioesterase